ncbi:MAG: hypothetical protein ABI949_08545 [Ilumatobacteraceae bacterium]
MPDRSRLGRSRWAAIGAAVAVTLSAGGMFVANAASSGDASSFVPITPCRLLDTRPDTNVGPRSVPIGAQEVAVFSVLGTNGNCTIPATATAVSANVTVVHGTEASFLTVWPSDVARPIASTNNWIAGQPAAPGKADVKLSSAGTFSAFNNLGNVDVIVDLVGYFEPVGDPTPDGGVEYAEGADATLATGTAVTITSIVVTAPIAGFVVVDGTAKLLIPSGNSVNCEIGTTPTIGTMGVQYVGGAAITALSQSRGFEVAAGDTTFFQVCQQIAGSGATTVQNNFLTAVYSPNRV